MPDKYNTFVVFVLVTLVLVTNAEEINENLSLYDSTDHVVVLNSTNFKNKVFNKTYSILIEFYNNYCSHCRRFTPIYKQLATELYDWRDVLLIGAIDCGIKENNGVCREYKILGFPSVRYLSPLYQPNNQTDNYGIEINSPDIRSITKKLARFMAAEENTSNLTNWPDFQAVQTASVPSLFEGLDSSKQFVILVYEPQGSTIGVETILNFLRYPDVAVKRITDLKLAAKYQIDSSNYKIAAIDRLGSIIPCASKLAISSFYKSKIKSFLDSQHITKKPEPKTEGTSTKGTSTKQLIEIIKEVKRNKHFVYQADLEMAIRNILDNEIPKVLQISGEKLIALQRFLNVLERYNPLGSARRTLISKLAIFVSHHNNELSGEDFESELKKLEKQLGPIYSATHYVGCTGSQHYYRGFTCSLWQLFHFMTVQAASMNQSQDPLEVLQAMHGYIKYFFGCADCSQHFQEMAKKRDILSAHNKDEAILWLWAAHNEVNQRLAGDDTEDPKFPKIQFPSAESCSQCYKQNETSSAVNSEDKWDKIKVLQFLKNIHNPKNLSRYGMENDELLQPTVKIFRQKRMLSSVFLDIDMRIGMLLYGFCTVILVAVLKLIACKAGSRKKHHAHAVLP